MKIFFIALQAAYYSARITFRATIAAKKPSPRRALKLQYLMARAAQAMTKHFPQPIDEMARHIERNMADVRNLTQN